MKTKEQRIAGQILFEKSELLDRMEGLALSWIGEEVEFTSGKRELSGEVVDAKFTGVRDSRGQFDLTVMGKSGRVKTIDYWENNCRIKEKKDNGKKSSSSKG